MSDRKSDYEWAEAGGFQKRLVPSMVVGGLIGIVLGPMILFVTDVQDPTALVIAAIVGCPIIG